MGRQIAQLSRSGAREARSADQRESGFAALDIVSDQLRCGPVKISHQSSSLAAFSEAHNC